MFRSHLLAVLSFVWSFAVLPSTSVLRGQNVTRIGIPQVIVTLDRDDWTYELGAKATFRITVTMDGQPVRGAELSYRVGIEMMPAPSQRAVTDEEGCVLVDGGTLIDPGFIRCVATLPAGLLHESVVGRATAGFAPDRIQPTQADPPDFDAFWAAGRDALKKVPVDARLTLQPERCTSTVNVFHVSLQNVGLNLSVSATSRIYGMLALPKAPGKYPALLHLPGAGVRAYGPHISLAERGLIVLNIGIHGIPVNLPDGVYADLANGALANYRVSDLDNRDLIYYRRVILGCLRANDFLTSHPQFNGQLIVTGSSQGGMLAIATAALDLRVSFLAASMPAYADVTGYLHGRAGGWPSMFQPAPDGSMNRNAVPTKIANTSYYDTVNFARRVKVPGIYTWGYNDETCPPTSTFSVYNVIKAPKQLSVALSGAHSSSPAQIKAIESWITDRIAQSAGVPPHEPAKAR